MTSSSSSPRSSPAGDNTSTLKISDESTPLLTDTASSLTITPVESSTQANGVYDDDDEDEDEDEDVPLPKVQILLLSFARIVEPISFFAILPYINQMVEDTGIATEDVGFYSGCIESLFSATQMCVMLGWGKAADHFGRKPVLVFSLFGITIATALFGMSKTVWQMVLFRCLAGVFAGTSVTIRAMFTENSTKKTQAKAFTYFAFSGNLGIFIGTIIGGSFESPAKKFPSTFGRVQFFHEYPYAFPGFIVSGIGLMTAVLASFSLKETLYLKQSRKPDQAPMTTWELVKAPGVTQVILIYNYIALMVFSYTAVNPVYLFEPVNRGGTGLSPGFIAFFLSISGIAQAFWLLIVFPPLHRRVGTGSILRLCAAAWPFFFAVAPLSNILLRYDLKVLFWIIAPSSLAIGSGVAMAFIASQLIVNNVAPSHETLGELNALVLALSCGLRAFVPALATSIYAVGVKYHILWGHIFWVLIFFIAWGLWFLLKILPENLEGAPKMHSDSEVDEA